MTTETKSKAFTITATLSFTATLKIEAASEDEAKEKAMKFLEMCDLSRPSEVDVTECPDIEISDVDD